jgi:hypothetical protein
LIARFLLLSARARLRRENRRARERRQPCRRGGCAAKFLNLWAASPTPDAAAGILPRASGQAFDQAADASTAERDVAKRDLVTRRAAMKTLVVRLVATLALALAATTAAFAQSRPPSCIPQYDASGAQVAPYCGP